MYIAMKALSVPARIITAGDYRCVNNKAWTGDVAQSRISLFHRI